MKIKVIAKLFMLCMISLINNAMELDKIPEQKAVQLVSENMIEVLRTMVTQNPQAAHGYALTRPAVQFSWLPGYIVKLNIDRIDGAESIVKPCIEQEQLNLLRLPKMYRCPVPQNIQLPGLPKIWLPRYLCVSEYIEGSVEAKINLEQARQIVILLTKAKSVWSDCKAENIIKTSDGQLGLIDTEIRGFYPCGTLYYEQALSHFYKYNQFEDDAKIYLRNEIKSRYNIELN